MVQIKDPVDGIEVQHNKDTQWKMDAYHFHDFLEIILTVSNGGFFFVGDSIYPIAKNNLFIFNTMDLHRSSVDGYYERYVIHFKQEMVADFCSRRSNLLDCFQNRPEGFVHCISLSAEDARHLIRLINKAKKEDDGYGGDISRKIALVEILLFINPLYQDMKMPGHQENTAEFSQILPILRYIQSHLDEQITLDILAANFYINKFHLCAIFKKATGFTVMEYVIHRRLLKARELLQQQLPVQRVGEMSGFNNNSHFIRTFKKVIGVSPKQYAKKFTS